MLTRLHSRRFGAVRRLGVVLGALLFGWTAVAPAASPGGDGSQPEFNITSWHTGEGLPDGNITALAQTPDGYLWIGTFKGLVRFDGVRFTAFNDRSAAGPVDDSIAALLVDGAGRLWVGGESGELLCYDHGRFQRMYSSSSTELTRDPARTGSRPTHTRSLRPMGLAEDEEGGVWWQRSRTNLVRVNYGVPTVYTATNGLPAGTIFALVADHARRPWLLAGNQFYRWHRGKWAMALDAGPLGPTDPVFGSAREGGLWCAAPPLSWSSGAGRVFRLQNEKQLLDWEPVPWKPNVQRSQVTAMIEDRRGRLWLGMHWSGVYVSNPDRRWQVLQPEGPLVQCRVTTLFEDRQGALWIGTLGDGLHRVVERLVTAVSLPEVAKDNLVNTVCARRDGSVWAGTDGAGVFRYQGGEFTQFSANEGLASPLVFSLLEDRTTNLWCGTAGGVFRWEAGQFRRQPDAGLAGRVLAMLEDREGSLWFGTGVGLFRRRQGEASFERVSGEAGAVEVRSIGQDRDGAIWAGTISTGVLCLRSNRLERFGPAEGVSNPDARSLWCAADGGVWVGTLGGGLFNLVNGRFRAITVADGLPNDTINSIVEDEQGRLWMGSYNGYFGCSRKLVEDYRRGRSPVLLCEWLNIAEGLHFRTCSGAGQPVVSRSKTGELWFANQNSLARFRPGSDLHTWRVAPVVIESVVVDDRELWGGGIAPVQVSSGAQRYEFHYASPDPDHAVNLSFRHQLAGLDEDWVEAGTRRVAYYNRIPPGRYTFAAMVGGPDGQWRESSQSVVLEVRPRWWERRAVQALAVLGGLLLLAFMVYGMARARYRRRLERVEAQQATERERRRIAQDLHDDLGTSLTEISLLSAVARSPSASAEEVQNHLSAIVERSSNMVKALDEIVWAANPKNDSVRNLANYLSFFAREFLQTTAIRCRLDVPATLPDTPLDPEQRHTLYLVVKEALANAAKHSGASELWLRITIAETSVRIVVEDNGRGFDPSTPSSRNGLSNMQARLDRIGGRCHIVSAPGQGARLTFELPLRRSGPRTLPPTSAMPAEATP